MSDKTFIFLSHISEEQSDALKAKQYLEHAFKEKVDVFAASSWTSIQPGEDWFDCISDAINKADVMIVFCSGDSVNRPWVQFETGAGWFAKKTKVIPVCHKGMTPAALPDPLRRLQAVDINSEIESERYRKLADAISRSTGLPEPSEFAAEAVPTGMGAGSQKSLRGWILRPTAHIGEDLTGVFRVGFIASADRERAEEAGIDPNDAIYVRLFLEPPSGQFLHSIAVGAIADFFEQDNVEGMLILAKLKLKAVHQTNPPELKTVPVIIIEKAEKRNTI
jgi:hypothetical protein